MYKENVRLAKVAGAKIYTNDLCPDIPTITFLNPSQLELFRLFCVEEFLGRNKQYVTNDASRESAIANAIASEKKRSDALAATINALRDIVTNDHETKEHFIARVRAVLGDCPDTRVLHAVAAERERIKKTNAPKIEKINAHIKVLKEAIAAEREACALECIAIANKPSNVVLGVALECAAAIRARGGA